FDRSKLIRGISRACERLPVSLDTIEDMAGRIEARLRESGEEVTSTEIGELVMMELAEVNNVAYVRFASVYREFTDISSFEQEIARLISKAGGTDGAVAAKQKKQTEK
ncbi:MAG: transcriptional repressor NrdR, partial [Pyramidobacter sp.]|nr:transcriptional repressor NrdR [Pyramidobacter sp.]